jgi:hypothetical protein
VILGRWFRGPRLMAKRPEESVQEVREVRENFS